VLHEHGDRVSGLVCHGGTLASVSWDLSLMLWDLLPGKQQEWDLEGGARKVRPRHRPTLTLTHTPFPFPRTTAPKPDPNSGPHPHPNPHQKTTAITTSHVINMAHDDYILNVAYSAELQQYATASADQVLGAASNPSPSPNPKPSP